MMANGYPTWQLNTTAVVCRSVVHTITHKVFYRDTDILILYIFFILHDLFLASTSFVSMFTMGGVTHIITDLGTQHAPETIENYFTHN
jgi:hypothetical protein